LSFVKSQILDQLTDTYPTFLKNDLEKVLNLVLNEMISALAKGENVEIRGFGSFKIKQLKSRIGRNPKDGSKVNIPAKRKIHWKMSKELFKMLNE
tara:strand:+ start:611 stop:895 length:285 start_codon:yes stop_codon:yes gene_type:complete